MDLNSVRILVTIAGFVLFAGLVVWTWRPTRRGAHDQAAMLPFEGDVESGTVGAQR